MVAQQDIGHAMYDSSLTSVAREDTYLCFPLWSAFKLGKHISHEMLFPILPSAL